ncbi:hypothetical protein WR25_00014 [Diploscapter pachys]|uniref:CBS domain-containing protein n=1 Tax=Diploscapter pachys TaxID=2018661 RepID=A0A2A2KDV8_9BILA|nr:hypothetical protein WR25_00014 [Diploscapter pachys]
MVTNSSRASPASGLSGGQSPNPTLYGRASPHNEFTQSMTEATAAAISRTSSKKGPTQWVRAAKSRASGTIRKHLFGKSKRTKDAEDLNGGPITERPEEDEFDDFTQSNYDTVKSLPATGHYGRSRVGTALHVDIEDHSLSPPTPSVVILKLPKRRTSQPPRISPALAFRAGAAPLIEPVFEFQAWHSSLDLQNSQDAVYSLFMKAHKCYDLIPTSTKLVVFDTHLPVRKAFYALVFNGVRAAPLWDSDKRQFTGMLTITDFIKILIRHYEAGDSEERMRALEEEEICHWRQQFELDGSLRPFVAIDPSESLYRAVQVLCESKVHRLPVLDRQTGNISYILTHKRIIKFLSLYINDLPRPSYMDQTPKELGIGSWGNVLSIHVNTPLHDALDIFLKNRVSALPLVDEEGRVVDIYAKFDVISLAAEKSYDKLDCTVQEALKHRSEWFEGVQRCLETDSLFSVLEAIVKAEVHRLIVTDSDRKVAGIISLSDILKYLILDPVLPDVSSAPGALTSSSTNRTLSSSTMEGGDSPLLMDVPEVMED